MFSDLLKDLTHYLSSIDNLYVADNPEFHDYWRLDCKDLIAESIKAYEDDYPYIVKVILNDYADKNFLIEYGCNQRLTVSEHTSISYDEGFITLFDDDGNPLHVINVDCIVSVYTAL